MPHPQFPIGSGFGAATTAQAVLAGLDLSHATAIVTGGHSGLGLETTRALAQAGARVIVARDAEAARAQTRDIARVQVEPLDLARLDSVRDFARRFLAGGQHVDMLICSAGIMACPETRVGPGWEAQFATNHLGHYALANLLWPALRSGARGRRLVRRTPSIRHALGRCAVHAGLRQMAGLRAVENRERPVCPASGQAGTRAWRARLSLHPGKIFTPLQRHLTRAEMTAAGWLDASGQPADPSFKTVQQGAATQTWAAASPQLEGMGGLYCEDCDVAALDLGEAPPSPACARTRSIPKRRRGFGRCPPGSPGSMRSPRAEPPAHAARTGKKSPRGAFLCLRETALTSPPTHPAWPASWTGSLGPSRPAPLPAASGRPR